MDFSGGSAFSAFNAGGSGSILGWEDPLEKRNGDPSSVLVWRIPWRQEPGGLQSTGSQKIPTLLGDETSQHNVISQVTCKHPSTRFDS